MCYLYMILLWNLFFDFYEVISYGEEEGVGFDFIDE